MKAQHRCVRCGSQDVRTLAGLVTCAACSEKDKIYYHNRRLKEPEKIKAKNVDRQAWRKMLHEAHLCVDCKQMDAYTLNGRYKCAVCAEKEAQRKRKWRAENSNRSREISTKYRQLWSESGRCSRCGHKLPFGYTYKMCERCRKQTSRNNEERRWAENPDRIKRGTPGICWLCVKRPVMEGKKICRECYDRILPISLQNIKKAQENNKEHFWRRLNKSIGQRDGGKD